MNLIKACPSCKTKLRFPIDKGTIKITCSCGYSFIANPDNTAIYNNAVFDLSGPGLQLKKKASLSRALAGIQFTRIMPAIINSALELKYKLQNFKLLPDEERKKIILVILVISAGIAGLIFAIFIIPHFLLANKKIII